MADNDAADPHAPLLRVMHPVHCLESRVHNVAGLNRSHPLGIRQLKASIIIAREYLRERLVANAKGPAAVSKLNERIFKFAYFNLNARKLFREYQIDPFDAVLADAELLTADFRAIHYPQMVAKLASQRKAR